MCSLHLWFDRTQELALLLSSWPSVTGSAQEIAFGPQLTGELKSWPYFAPRPEQVRSAPAGRYLAHNVYALVRGQGRRTVVLSGHYDTVSVEHYGELAHLATQPLRLKSALIAEWQGRERSPAEDKALSDLLSGDFLPGRGLLDMKSGLAAGLAVLERYADLPEDQRPGNVLFIAHPDEEGRSSGARACVQELPEIAEQWNLDLVGGLNLDATSDHGDGSAGRAAYLGTVGKLLLTLLVVGRPAHACYPFEGSSAALMAAQIVQAIEGEGLLADAAHGEAASPPSCLDVRALRTHYDVTTPSRIGCAFNVLTHQRSPQQVLELFTPTIQAAAQRALSQFGARAQAAGDVSAPELSSEHVSIWTYADVVAKVRERGQSAALEHLIAHTPPGPNPLAASLALCNAAFDLAGLTGPAVVVGFGGVAYPHVHLADVEGYAPFWELVARECARMGEESGQSVKLRHYFSGISDMSFLGRAANSRQQQVIADQTPHPEHVDTPPQGSLSYPSVNIGPWGRDYHQKLERVHAPYSFGLLPELLWRLTLGTVQAP